MDILLEDIIERDKNAKAKIESQDLDKNKKAEKEKATAEEVRKQTMERMADSKQMFFVIRFSVRNLIT